MHFKYIYKWLNCIYDVLTAQMLLGIQHSTFHLCLMRYMLNLTFYFNQFIFIYHQTNFIFSSFIYLICLFGPTGWGVFSQSGNSLGHPYGFLHVRQMQIRKQLVCLHNSHLYIPMKNLRWNRNQQVEKNIEVRKRYKYF